MAELAIVVGFIVVAFFTVWIVREKDDIRRYRDHLEMAAEETGDGAEVEE